MKKYLLLLLVPFIVGFTVQQMHQGVIARKNVVSGANPDVFYESFNGSGYQNTNENT